MAKLNLKRVLSKKNMKKTAKTIFIAGVWYYVGKLETNRYETSSGVRSRNRKQSSRERYMKKR